MLTLNLTKARVFGLDTAFLIASGEQKTIIKGSKAMTRLARITSYFTTLINNALINVWSESGTDSSITGTYIVLVINGV